MQQQSGSPAKQRWKVREHMDVNIRVEMQVGLVYIGPIYMGSGANEMNVVYDTGSDVSLVV